MRISISLPGTFHSVMLANALIPHATSIEILSPAPRRFFKSLHETVRTRLIPSPVLIAARILRWNFPGSMDRASAVFFDHSVAALMASPDVYVGWATVCLKSAIAAKRRGAHFVLDRACPHRDFQESLVEQESEKVGATFSPQPEWFRQRQLQEYDLADAILVPSGYTARTFPTRLQAKLVKAPLSARCSYPKHFNLQRNKTFTVGVVGGHPLRKGYLYLLRAWEKLALPNARLLLRCGDFREFPLLQDIARRITNVEFVNFVPNITDFYKRCDAFALPSMDDGFGMALVEAMAHGCACVTTTNTGASELLTHGKDALVVKPGDEDALADSLLRLYESEELRQALALAGRITAESIISSSDYERGIGALMNRMREPVGMRSKHSEVLSSVS